jgi:acyl-coenzyme A thioesterase PaaI-like protein
MHQALRLYNKLSRYPLGKWLFTRIICFKAPYFGSISPRIEELKVGRLVASMPRKRSVKNHIGTIHAIALCNLAELVAGTMIEVSLPPNLRWIPKGMTVRYTKKSAFPRVTATGELPALVGDGPQDVVIPVIIRGTDGTVVLEADITMYVSPRPAKA